MRMQPSAFGELNKCAYQAPNSKLQAFGNFQTLILTFGHRIQLKHLILLRFLVWKRGQMVFGFGCNFGRCELQPKTEVRPLDLPSFLAMAIPAPNQLQ